MSDNEIRLIMDRLTAQDEILAAIRKEQSEAKEIMAPLAKIYNSSTSIGRIMIALAKVIGGFAAFLFAVVGIYRALKGVK
jgi:hypothetical protein